MPFLWTTLRVSNLERSLQFYQDVVGLPLKNRLKHPGMEIAFLGDGETLVELICEESLQAVDLGTHVTMGFGVADLDQALAETTAKGVPILGNPIQAGPRTRFFFVKDPDGMTIQFVEEK